MNSLSILSSRVDKVIGSTPTTPTSEAFKELRHQQLSSPETHIHPKSTAGSTSPLSVSTSASEFPGPKVDATADEVEKMPKKPERSALKRLYSEGVESWVNAYEWVVLTIALCACWIASWFYDEKGNFSAILPVYTIILAISRAIYSPTESALPAMSQLDKKKRRYSSSVKAGARSGDGDSAVASSTALSTLQAHHSRTHSITADSNTDDITPRRSIRIRLFNENSSSKPPKAASVKSPTSPSTSTLRLTKYPRNTGPPQPLLARNPSQKTLILDLDETLIHSLSKGGRLTSGHMVEVKLEGQHPILYYVHKRPYCEEFLRKV